MTSRSVLAATLLSLAATPAFAHPPASDESHEPAGTHAADLASVRTWTIARSGDAVRGSFLASRVVDGNVKVSIEQESGDVVVLAMAELTDADRLEAQRKIDRAAEVNARLVAEAIEIARNAGVPVRAAGDKPPQAAPFDAFAPHVKTRWDDRWLFVESDGIPHEPAAHQLMVGIRAWQQQVPLPQPYTDDNAWRFPLKPEIADKPVSAKEQLFRGAIAIAANGIPIFNPIKNDGRTDTFLAGELDQFGGHCGRADDYHYHIAPLTLQKVLGKNSPVAYALDGFPIYGYFDPAAKAGNEKVCPLGSTVKLDELNGHFAPAEKGAPAGTRGLYHYHASPAYPYLNGGLKGKVTVKDDQIDPQPRANPVRESGTPLRGASITGFKTLGEKSWSLEYTLGGQKHFWNYRIEDGKYIFDLVDPDGTKRTETYTGRPQRDRPQGDNRQPPRDDRRPPRGNDRDRPQDNRPPRRDEAPNAPAQADHPKTTQPKAATDFDLASPAVGNDSRLPAEFTCDGASISPPLAWANPPAGTKSFAITMHHIPGPPRPGDKPGEDKHVYLVLYNIPATTLSLENALKPGEGAGAGFGWGVNTVNRRPEYAPPCSKGPGDKKYTLTVYALSDVPKITPADRRGATMDELLAAIKDTTLGTSTLDVIYARTNGEGKR